MDPLVQGEFVLSQPVKYDPEITIYSPVHGLESIQVTLGVPFRLVLDALKERMIKAITADIHLWPEEIDQMVIELDGVDDSAFEDGDSGLKINFYVVRRVALAEDAATEAVQKSLIDSQPVIPLIPEEEDDVPF